MVDKEKNGLFRTVTVFLNGKAVASGCIEINVAPVLQIKVNGNKFIPRDEDITHL